MHFNFAGMIEDDFARALCNHWNTSFPMRMHSFSARYDEHTKTLVFNIDIDVGFQKEDKINIEDYVIEYGNYFEEAFGLDFTKLIGIEKSVKIKEDPFYVITIQYLYLFSEEDKEILFALLKLQGYTIKKYDMSVMFENCTNLTTVSFPKGLKIGFTK